MPMRGWKTYAAAVLAILVQGARSLGYLDESQANALTGVFAALGLAALRSAVPK